MLVKAICAKKAQSYFGMLLNAARRKPVRIEREVCETVRRSTLQRLEQLPALQDFERLSDTELLALVNREVRAARDV